jgi:hypothetical protein
VTEEVRRHVSDARWFASQAIAARDAGCDAKYAVRCVAMANGEWVIVACLVLELLLGDGVLPVGRGEDRP